MSNSPEDQQVLDQLVYRVCRAFYEPKYIVVMDVINKMKQVKDEELAATLKLNKREVHKICGKLKEDRLIKDLMKMEARKPDQRPIPNTYYYLDYKLFVDVVKYKIHRMGKELDATLSKAEVENAGLKCPACLNAFAVVDVMHLLDESSQKFMCPNDGFILDEETVEDDQEGQEAKTKLRENTKPIVDLLKLTDNIVIEQYTESMASKKAAARTHDDDDLAFAEDGGQQQGEIQVVFQDDNDKAAKKARENEANKKRQQNAVPLWHAWSTVSGEMTTLGAAAAKLQELPADGADADENEDVEDDTERDDYYKQYYENLAVSQEHADEESFETLDTTNDNGKRPLEDGQYSSGKRYKTDDEPPEVEDGGEEELYEGGDDEEPLPDVYVAGVLVPLLEVTEEHQSQMTPDEYQRYYDICQRFQG
ncbi:hypothetical protein BX616_003294 [Lobosporangium transversale]|uniref:TFIIE alpha subunit-domain-containing protein n=1 Tax=Lobosporangium transversale TaxID=64571 RepID=A0A1Y2GNR2_9FUNG|nr:TFIIE alpha subunit-domain-containing protein [Lobosporangium transversale]KAF9899080.1 hypothetical protein BX616_003294 [Lobosporangium transversale]ORZ15007.1 TFIIE alpha subunit-domain-containing protein [Lobosporangium transversale]|eukprot:XP_021881139.1 TFIIE alpha subunit-domain-containing protein [Lobosporangium transversale]